MTTLLLGLSFSHCALICIKMTLKNRKDLFKKQLLCQQNLTVQNSMAPQRPSW